MPQARSPILLRRSSDAEDGLPDLLSVGHLHKLLLLPHLPDLGD